MFYYFCRNTCHDGTARATLCDNGTETNNGVVADAASLEYGGVLRYPYMTAQDYILGRVEHTAVGRVNDAVRVMVAQRDAITEHTTLAYLHTATAFDIELNAAYAGIFADNQDIFRATYDDAARSHKTCLVVDNETVVVTRYSHHGVGQQTTLAYGNLVVVSGYHYNESLSYLRTDSDAVVFTFCPDWKKAVAQGAQNIAYHIASLRLVVEGCNNLREIGLVG